MRVVDLIRKKRDGGVHSREEIEVLVQGYVAGDIPDYQISAWLMAVFHSGMSPEETGALTRAMIASGEVLSFGSLGPLVDKHSTGGVGDKISLPLAPLAAACGLKIPMMSGRGLGHTGGTLDKLESMVGYNTQLDALTIRSTLTKNGYAIFGQSEAMVPADRLLYALRDVTASVESIPLITASILSKKFAEGADALVFDVKCGTGAFMKAEAEAKKLAESLTSTAAELGKSALALVTNMDEPLGRMVGNWLEVEEGLDILEGRGPADVRNLTLELCARMLVLGFIVPDLPAGLGLARTKLDDGHALERFLRNVSDQGGNPDQVLSDRRRRRAYYSQEAKAPDDGWVQGWNSLEVGLVAGMLGAGRDKKEDRIHPNAGIEFLAVKGDHVERGQTLCLLWADDESKLQSATRRLQEAVTLGSQPPTSTPLLIGEIRAP